MPMLVLSETQSSSQFLEAGLTLLASVQEMHSGSASIAFTCEPKQSTAIASERFLARLTITGVFGSGKPEIFDKRPPPGLNYQHSVLYKGPIFNEKLEIGVPNRI